MRAWRWAQRECYAWWPSWPWGKRGRARRDLRRISWERRGLGIPGAPRIGWAAWERVQRVKTKKVRDVLEQKEKKE